MSIRINAGKCSGCMKCADVCPGSLIEGKDGKAFMRYPDLCWGCASCVKECGRQAIEFFLGADIGGRGGTLTVQKKGGILNWYIHKLDGEQVVIPVNPKNANRY